MTATAAPLAPERPLITTNEAAEILDVPPARLREMRAAGTSPAAHLVAGRLMFDPEEVRAHAALARAGQPAYRVIAPADLPRGEWLAVRRQGLGASDDGAALGMDPWHSPHALWLEKTGRWDEDGAGEAAAHGLGLEPYVAGLFARNHPDLLLTRSPGVLAHAEHPWMLANPDRLAVDQAGQLEVVELKAPGLRMAPEWVGDEVPARYIVQVVAQMAVTGARGGWFGALIGGQNYVERYISRDDELIDALVERLGEWWQRHVVDDQPPKVDGSERTTSILSRLYKVDPNAVVELPEDVDSILVRLTKAKAEEKAAGVARGELENQLRVLLGPNEIGTRGGHVVVTNKQNGTFAPKRFAADHPDLYEQYLVDKPGLDAKALERDHPDIYAQYRARTLRPKEL